MPSRWIGLAVAAALAGGAAAADSHGEGAGATPGRELFGFYCASCHGGDGTGNGPVASALNTRPADLTRIAARRSGIFPAGEIAEYIDGRRDVAAHGPRDMPVWGRVLAEKIGARGQREIAVAAEIQLLVDFLRAIQVRSEPVPGPRG